jgi:hypothetical protein
MKILEFIGLKIKAVLIGILDSFKKKRIDLKQKQTTVVELPAKDLGSNKLRSAGFFQKGNCIALLHETFVGSIWNSLYLSATLCP